ncbi:PKD domain-containing protein, partial [Candidatus Bathyarchaeota archaeon]
GEQSTEPYPSHIFQEEGTYTVTILVVDAVGETDTDTATCTVAQSKPKPPIAEANGPYSGSINHPIQFTSNGSTDPDGEITQYQWDFGDGQYSNEESPIHSYPIEGLYLVKLTVYDVNGLESSDTTTSTINQPKPSINPSNIILSNIKPVAEGNGPYSGIEMQSIVFNSTGSYDPDGKILEYHWDFDDNETSTDSQPIHIYETTGLYNVILTVTDAAAASSKYTTYCVVETSNRPPTAYIDAVNTAKEGQMIEFNSIGSNDPDGKLIEYYWSFGDGSESTETNTSHIYSDNGTYTASLTVTDDRNLEATAAIQILITENHQPIPIITGPNRAETGEFIRFSATNSHDPDGEILEYYFDFGDNTYSNGPSVSHLYAVPGVYNVVLRVTDDNGDQAIETLKCRVTTNQPPTIIAHGPYLSIEGMALSFNPTIDDPDGWVESVSWRFGDGTSSTDFNPTHVYNNSGEYIIQVTLTDNLGQKTELKTIAVITPGEDPIFPTITSATLLSIASFYLLNRKYQLLSNI